MNGLGRVMLRQKRPEKAEELFRTAAEAGYTPAMVSLGRLLEKRDRSAAEQWYRRAADEGDAEGMLELGRIMLKQRKPDDARRLLEAALAKGDGRAKRPLKVLDRFAPASPARPPRDIAITAHDLRYGTVVERSDGHRYLVKMVGPVKRGVMSRRTVYEVEVHDLTLRNTQSLALIPKATINVVGEFETKKEAQDFRAVMAERIVAGDWQPPSTPGSNGGASR